MRKLLTYIRILVLLVVWLALPGLSFAQEPAADVNVSRLCDSLKNLIAQDTDNRKLADHNYELAHMYIANSDYQNSIEAARQAAFAYKSIGNSVKELECYLFMADNNIQLLKLVETIKNYLSARNVLDRMQLDDTNKANVNKYKELDADLVYKIGSIYFSRGHLDRSIENFDEALAVYDELKCTQKALGVKAKLAACHVNKKNYDIALLYYTELRDSYIRKNDWPDAKSAYQRIAEIHLAKGDFDNLYKCNRELYDSTCLRDNIKEQLNALNNLAFACVCNHNYEDAIQYYSQLESTDPNHFESGKNADSLLANTYNNLGLCYYNIGNTDLAADYLQKAIDLHEKYSNFQCASHSASLLAHIYYLEGDYHNADHYQKEAVDFAEQSGERLLMEQAYKNYNEILRGKNDYAKALDYYQKYLNLQEKGKYDKEQTLRKHNEDLKHFSDVEKKYSEGLAEEEIKYLNERTKAAEEQQRLDREEMLRREVEAAKERQMLDQARLRALAEALTATQEAMQANRERDSIERERVELEAKKAAVEKEAQLKEQAANQERINQKNQIELQKREKNLITLALIFAGVVILFFVGFLISMRKKNKKLKEQQAEIELKNADLIAKNEEITIQKENLQAANNEILTKNEELSRQKEVIEQANKSITDSIVYAKRIQTAVSPSPKFLTMYNFEYFMFFRPRDIVSGDYYWFHADDHNHIFICAADCTGHGVPGAFMSMLGISLFNKIVAERNIIEPDLILNHLREEVKAALHQDSIKSSQKDGMDLSLVRYDVDTQMLHFAAANNNGYLVQHFRKDEEEKAKANLAKPEHLRETGDGYLRLTIMPSDSMPIGVYIREKESFTKTSYQLREGDSFYLTSDGYIDQFGGKWGRKFLTKNFQKLVMDINQYDMNRQEKIVVSTHEEWIGDSYEQLDDIIVIGVRV